MGGDAVITQRVPKTACPTFRALPGVALLRTQLCCGF